MGIRSQSRSRAGGIRTHCVLEDGVLVEFAGLGVREQRSELVEETASEVPSSLLDEVVAAR